MIIRDIFSYFSLKHVVTTHLNCLVKTVQMRGHNICFYAEQKLSLIIINYSLSRALSPLIECAKSKDLDWPVHLCSLISRCFCCCLTSTVNIHGHVGTVSKSNHTFPGQA